MAREAHYGGSGGGGGEEAKNSQVMTDRGK
jgi:hypothetical protein